MITSNIMEQMYEDNNVNDIITRNKYNNQQQLERECNNNKRKQVEKKHSNKKIYHKNLLINLPDDVVDYYIIPYLQTKDAVKLNELCTQSSIRNPTWRQMFLLYYGQTDAIQSWQKCCGYDNFNKNWREKFVLAQQSLMLFGNDVMAWTTYWCTILDLLPEFGHKCEDKEENNNHNNNNNNNNNNNHNHNHNHNNLCLCVYKSIAGFLKANHYRLDNDYINEVLFHSVYCRKPTGSCGILCGQKYLMIEYVTQMNFTNIPFDVAARAYLSVMGFPKRALYVNRTIDVFAKVYHKQNPGTFQNSDEAHILLFAMILLSTDLTSATLDDKMTIEEWETNISNLTQQRNNNNNNDHHFNDRNSLLYNMDYIRNLFYRVADFPVLQKMKTHYSCYVRITRKHVRALTDGFVDNKPSSKKMLTTIHDFFKPITFYCEVGNGNLKLVSIDKKIQFCLDLSQCVDDEDYAPLLVLQIGKSNITSNTTLSTILHSLETFPIHLRHSRISKERNLPFNCGSYWHFPSMNTGSLLTLTCKHKDERTMLLSSLYFNIHYRLLRNFRQYLESR